MPRQSKAGMITREECVLKEKHTTEKLEAIHSDVTEMRKELQTALAWQNQFKGGLKAFGLFIGFCGTLGGVIFGGIKLFASFFRHP